MSAAPPIFLSPLSRTGGTLFVTMLDAHPDIAMSYEIYERDLCDEEGRGLAVREIMQSLAAARRSRGADRDDGKWIKSLPKSGLRVFFLRARRAGVRIDDALSELAELESGGGSLESLDGRLDYIDRLMILKMRQTGKRVWGGKARVDPRELHRRHPDASFFVMIRDGRDMFASMKHTGSFSRDPGEAAHAWTQHIDDFRSFARQPGVRSMEIRYEELVREPARVLEDACSMCGLAFSELMLRYHEQDLSLLRNPHGHLSHRQLAQGLNESSVGRWRRDLDAGEVESFTRIAGDMLERLGYS